MAEKEEKKGLMDRIKKVPGIGAVAGIAMMSSMSSAEASDNQIKNMEEHKKPITTMENMKAETPSWNLTPEQKANYEAVSKQIQQDRMKKIQEFQKMRQKQIMQKRGFDPKNVDKAWESMEK